MQTRRLVHPAKDAFVEIYWEGLEVEIVAGALGTKGRARRTECGSVREAETLVAGELAKRVKAGFVEVTAEAPPAIQAQTAPRARSAPAMIAEIVAHPADDAPRLVYADYLLAQGDPLGELIAIQCERARLPAWAPAQKHLADREDQLLVAFRRRWVGDLADEVVVRFRRGFVDRIRLERAGRDPQTRTIVDRAFARFPLLDTLAVDATVSLAAIGSPEAIARFGRLEVKGMPGEPIGDLVARVPHARALAIRAGGIGRDGILALPARAWRELDFHVNTLGGNGARALVGKLAPPDALAALDLSNGGIAEAGLRVLVEAGLANLRALHLAHTRAALAPLAAHPRALPALARLDLGGDDLRGQLARHADALAAALPSLVELHVRGADLTDDDAAALARSPLAARLVSLTLAKCGLTAGAARALAAGAWPALRHANLGSNPLGDGADVLRARFAGVDLALRGASGSTMGP